MTTEGEDLVNLSTGAVAPPEVSRELMADHTVGKTAYQEFKVRLEEDHQNEKCYEKLKKTRPENFY